MDPNAPVPQGDDNNFIPPPLEETPGVVPPPVVPPQEQQVMQTPTVGAATQPPVEPINPAPAVEPPPPPVNPAPPGIPAHKSSPIFVIALIVLLIAILGLAGYFLYTKYSGDSVSNEAVSTVVTPVPVIATPVPDPTANWKTYTSSKSQISFKYPINLTELSETEAKVPGPVTGNPIFKTTFGDKNTILPNTEAPFDGFSIYEVDTSKINGFSFNSYLDTELKEVQSSLRAASEAAIVKVANNISYIDTEKNIRNYFILSPDSKKIEVFSRIDSTTAFLTTFDNILSTFEFVISTTSATSSPSAVPLAH